MNLPEPANAISPRVLGANILISAPQPTQREVRSGSFSTEMVKTEARTCPLRLQ